MPCTIPIAGNIIVEVSGLLELKFYWEEPDNKQISV